MLFCSTSLTLLSRVVLIYSKRGHDVTWICYAFQWYLVTPWCRVLLEKLTGLQLVKKFPAFHGTRMFITALTSVRHISLSWANPIQSIYPHPTSWRSILILSTHLRLGLPIFLLNWHYPFRGPVRHPFNSAAWGRSHHSPTPLWLSPWKGEIKVFNHRIYWHVQPMMTHVGETRSVSQKQIIFI